MTLPEERSTDDEAQEDADDSRGSELVEAADREARSLQQGRSVSLLGGEIPLRVLAAFAIFIAVFVAVLLALWAALGGVGLALGMIVGALVGALAVKLVLGRGGAAA
jgi:hypothetical protein